MSLSETEAQELEQLMRSLPPGKGPANVKYTRKMLERLREVSKEIENGQATT